MVATMNAYSHDMETTPSMEDLQSQLEALKKAVLKTKQEIEGCLDKNVRAEREQVYIQRDIRDIKYELEGERHYQVTVANYINQHEDILQGLQQRLQYVSVTTEVANMVNKGQNSSKGNHL